MSSALMVLVLTAIVPVASLTLEQPRQCLAQAPAWVVAVPDTAHVAPGDQLQVACKRSAADDVWDFEVPPVAQYSVLGTYALHPGARLAGDLPPGPLVLVARWLRNGSVVHEERRTVGPATLAPARLQAKAKERLAGQQAWDAARAAVRQTYAPLANWSAWTWEQAVHPELLAALHQATPSDRAAALARLVQPVPGATEVFRLPALSGPFMTALLDELAHAAARTDVAWTRPNTMNNYGFLLAEIGLQPLLQELLQHVLQPLGNQFLSNWTQGVLDSQHTFTIRYQRGQDVALARHMDLSQVTLNVCLGRSPDPTFVGGDLALLGQRGAASEHTERITLAQVPGYGVFHAGQHWHAAEPLLQGKDGDDGGDDGGDDHDHDDGDDGDDDDDDGGGGSGGCLLSY